MASAENVQLAAKFGLFMLSAGGFGLLLGTTLGRSGLISRITQSRDFYITCCSHLAVGAFCYFAQFFVETGA
jgi:hypothetical protein